MAQEIEFNSKEINNMSPFFKLPGKWNLKTNN